MYTVGRLLNQRKKIEQRGTAEEQGLLATVLLVQAAVPDFVAGYAEQKGHVSAQTIPGIDSDFASWLDCWDQAQHGDALSLKYC